MFFLKHGVHTDKKKNLHMNIIIKPWVYTVNRYMQRHKNTSQTIIAPVR